MENKTIARIFAAQDREGRRNRPEKYTGITSHAEGYMLAMQEQETAMRATIRRRQKDDALPIKCKLCKAQEETVFHVLGSCPSLSSNLYTDHRHEKLGEIIVQEILRDDQVNKRWGPPADTYTLQTRKSITDLILWYGNSKETVHNSGIVCPTRLQRKQSPDIKSGQACPSCV